MTAEEFRLHKKYSWDGSGLVMIDELGNPIGYQEFAEAYAEQENKRIQKELDDAERIIDPSKARLQQENKELRELLKKCYPYLHELQSENFKDAGAGISYDQSLEDVFNALCKAVGVEWIEEQALNKE